MSFIEFLTVAIIAAVVGVLGNSCVQRRISHLHRVDDLKHRYYDFMHLTTGYWRSSSLTEDKRKELESKIIASQMIIDNEHRLISEEPRCLCGASYRTRKSYNTTLGAQTQLWITASGGSFQQKDWKPDHDRARDIIKSVLKIVNEFY